MENTDIKITDLTPFHDKKVKHFVEKWNEDSKSVQFIIVFDDEQEMVIEPFIDKNAKFESSRDILRLKYSK